jgi:cytochrome c556
MASFSMNSHSMGPQEISAKLRRIASMIDASNQPSKTLVAQALKSIIAEIDPARVERQVNMSERVQDQLNHEAEKARAAIEALKKLVEQNRAEFPATADEDLEAIVNLEAALASFQEAAEAAA